MYMYVYIYTNFCSCSTCVWLGSRHSWRVARWHNGRLWLTRWHNGNLLTHLHPTHICTSSPKAGSSSSQGKHNGSSAYICTCPLRYLLQRFWTTGRISSLVNFLRKTATIILRALHAHMEINWHVNSSQRFEIVPLCNHNISYERFEP